MVSRKETIMFFETKATREKWLDRFAVSNLPINHLFLDAKTGCLQVQKMELVQVASCFL
jgi:hypothetical protein